MNKEDEMYRGIGGWLILPTIGLIIAPIRLSLFVFKDLLPIFTQGYWSVLTTPGSEVYHHLWAPLLIFEAVGNIGFIIFAIIVMVYLFTKSRLLPRMIIAFMILNLLFVIADFFLANMIPAVAEQRDIADLKELVRTFIGTVIWVPYFLFSKRVQQTFVN